MRRLLLASCSVFALSGGVAKADPISLAVAAASTATAALSGTLITFGAVNAGLATAVAVDFAVRATLGYALNALSSSTTRGGATTRGYQNVNQLGVALPHQVIYGETRIGGAVFYQAITSSSGNKQDQLNRLIAFAGHEIDSYQAIYLNDEELTLDGSGNVTAPADYVGKVRIKQYLGTDAQTADADLVSAISEWTDAHRAQGIAYLYVRFQDAAAFPNGVPTVTARIRGKKVEDPRTSTIAWSDNPALCIRDYLLSDYGLSESTADLDGTLFEAAADACDVTVNSAAIYTLNGSFTLDADPEDVIRNLLSSMGGIFWNYWMRTICAARLRLQRGTVAATTSTSCAGNTKDRRQITSQTIIRKSLPAFG